MIIKTYIYFLSSKIKEKIIKQEVFTEYYWYDCVKGDKRYIHLAYDKNNLYDGDENTNKKKIIIDKDGMINNENNDDIIALAKLNQENSNEFYYKAYILSNKKHVASIDC